MEMHGGSILCQDTDSPFSRRSSREAEEDDLEALTWAALKRLPSYKHIYTAVVEDDIPVDIQLQHAGLAGKGADYTGRKQVLPVDVRRLGKHDRQRLLEKAFATTDQDNEILLQRLKQRIDRVDIKLPTVEVRFQNLSVHADVYTGSRALPTLINFVRDVVENCLAAVNAVSSRKRDLAILRNVSGVIKPGRMTLLLGPPGAGKSTLLLALAGKLGSDLRKKGAVTFNGHTFSEFIPQRTCSYISQDDEHIGELTVRETLDFAARCQGVGFKYDIMLELAQREREQNIHPDPQIDAFMKAMAVEGKKHSLSTDYIMKVLGLEICADTIVGSDMIRGVSGGQKKRVTTGEMVVGPKKTLFMDEISTGLDSSTTYQIVKCIRNFVHLLQGTVLMALLQPAPEIFDLFDDIILLSEGHIVYLGPRDRVLEFFESLGFKLPPRKGIADFLQEVTSKKDQEQYWADKTKPYQFMPVSTIAQAFANFEVGMELQKTLEMPFNKKDTHPAALVKKRYAIPKWDLFKACFERELLLISSNKFLYTFRTCQVGIVAFITATLFLRTTLSPSDEANGFLYLSTLFYALVHMMFNGLSEMTFTVARLPVLYKQRDNLFYPSWAFSVPSWILRIPYSFVESIIWSCIVYYSVGLAPEAGRFFQYMLLLFLMHQMAVGLFRLIGAIGRSMVVAQTFGSFALLVVFLLGGFILSKDNIHPWWVWAFWISPLSYAQNAIAVNEFLAPRWKKLSSTGRQLSLSILESRGFQTEGYWYWIAIGALIGYIFLFNFLVTLALGYLKPLGRPQAAVLSEGSQGKTSRKSAHNIQEIQMQSMVSSTGTQPSSRNGTGEGMTLPFQPLSLAFHNVCYYVDMPVEMRNGSAKGERLQLLQKVSGAFRPGVLTALVGVSGAGKTTLMDVLAGRKTGGDIDGDIRISGYPKRQETFARVAGYVEQTDIHSPQLTVRESLTFSSCLRLPKETAFDERRDFVEEVMKLVELNSLQNALVGLPGTSGLSTEQRKRLTIAVELVANPSIIFMDEPTSGLDARAAAIVMRTVRNTVNTGRTVVCTIHQPSIDIFEAFDELILMKRGGQIIYGGPLGQHSSLMIEYFQNIDGVAPIKDGQNPATWMLEISTPYAEEKIGKDLAEIYLNSNLYRNNEALIEELSAPAIGQKDLEFSSTYSQTSWTQLLACLWKQRITYWRSPEYNVVRFFFTTVCAILFGTIFWNLGSKRKTQQDVANVMGALYASVLFLGVNNASSVQPIVAVERAVFYRERAAGMYHALSYAIAQGLIEIPYILVQTLLYGTITYSMINFEWIPGKFFYYMLFMFLTFTYFTFYGMMAVGLSPTQQMAAVVSSAFYSIWNLFSGFLIPHPRMPPWWSWYYYICPVSWTLHGLVGSQLGDVNTLLTASGGQQITVAQYIRTTFGFGHDQLDVCIGVLVAFAVTFWLIFSFALKFLNHQRR